MARNQTVGSTASARPSRLHPLSGCRRLLRQESVVLLGALVCPGTRHPLRVVARPHTSCSCAEWKRRARRKHRAISTRRRASAPCGGRKQGTEAIARQCRLHTRPSCRRWQRSWEGVRRAVSLRLLALSTPFSFRFAMSQEHFDAAAAAAAALSIVMAAADEYPP